MKYHEDENGCRHWGSVGSPDYSKTKLASAATPAPAGGSPHHYVPDTSQYMGDCAICGNVADSPMHIERPSPAGEEAEAEAARRYPVGLIVRDARWHFNEGATWQRERRSATSIFDFEPQLAFERFGPERSLRFMVEWFYKKNGIEPKKAAYLAQSYFAALPQVAPDPDGMRVSREFMQRVMELFEEFVPPSRTNVMVLQEIDAILDGSQLERSE